MTDAALRIVLGVREADEISALRRKLAAASKHASDASDHGRCHGCVPCTLALVGELFEHRAVTCLATTWITTSSSMDVQRCGLRRSRLQKLANVPSVHGTGIGSSYGAANGGMRDVIGAWPQKDYWVYDNEGNYDESVICLPPHMCYCFRRIELPDEYESDEQ